MTQTKTHNVKQRHAVYFLNNFLDMVLTNGGPKGFAGDAAKKICFALKKNDLCGQIIYGDKNNNNLTYNEEESLFLTSLEEHLVCLHNKPQYKKILDTMGYKNIVPASKKPCEITVTSGLFEFTPDSDMVNKKLQLFCNNIEEHNGKIDLFSLRESAKELILPKSQNATHKVGVLGLLMSKWLGRNYSAA